MRKKNFSMIELMTVIVVILILLTLLIPSLNNIQKKARTIICATQLKQLGVLISTYANDNDGFLPYTFNWQGYPDYKASYFDTRQGRLYGSWAGHLLPYLNTDLKSWERGKFYHDKARKASGYSYVFYENSDDIEKNASVDADENFENWKLLHDMYYEGGHGDLKLFVCPEATRTYISKFLPQDRKIPRISGSLPAVNGFALIGLPSSYLANGQLFGKQSPSLRFEDINKQNYLLLEGSDQDSLYMDGLSTPVEYSKFFESYTVYGGTVNVMAWGSSGTNQVPGASPPRFGASFFHDNTEEIWYSWRGWMSVGNSNRYNNIFNPRSMASVAWDMLETKLGMLSSSEYPGENWENFETDFTAGRYNIYRYYGAEEKMGYFYGNMNLLTADLSVKSGHMGWLFGNARVLGENTD